MKLQDKFALEFIISPSIKEQIYSPI
jgi:hypothetical protein